MKKTSLMALAVLLGIASGANAAWWDEANSDYRQFSNSQVYTQDDEDMALQMAIAASLNVMDTREKLELADDVWEPANLRTEGVRKANKVGAQVWLNNTFDEGPNSAYALVRTQRELAETYSPVEKKSGSFKAQAQLMDDANLSEEDLLAYVLQLSLLDR